MSETVGFILIIIGVAASLVGLLLLSRTARQALGLALMAGGLVVAGVGWLAVDQTQVGDPPGAATPSDEATAIPGG